MTVDVADAVAARGVQVQRKAAGPLAHPGHGHPAEQVALGCFEGSAALRVALGVRAALALDQAGQSGTVEGHRCLTASGRDAAIESERRLDQKLCGDRIAVSIVQQG